MVLRDQGNEGHELLAPLGTFRAGPEGACGTGTQRPTGETGSQGRTALPKENNHEAKGCPLRAESRAFLLGGTPPGSEGRGEGAPAFSSSGPCSASVQ